MKYIYPALLILLLYSCKDTGPSQPIAILPVSAEDSTRMAILFARASTRPDSAGSLLQRAEEVAAKGGANRDLYYLLLGRHYIQNGKLDEATATVHKALAYVGADTLKYRAAKFYNLLGAAAAYKQQHELGVTHFNTAIKLFEADGDTRQAAAIKFNLANLFFSRLDFESAYKYSLEADRSLTLLKDTVYLPLCKAIVSVAAGNLNKNKEAVRYAEGALSMSRQYNSVMGILLADYALGEVEMHKDNYAGATTLLLQVVHQAELLKQYNILLPARAALLKSYLMQENYEEAISFGAGALKLSVAMNNTDIRYSLLKNLAFSYAGVGRKDKAFDYLKEAEQEFRDKSTLNNQELMQEMLIKYETEKKNNVILQQRHLLDLQKSVTIVWIAVSLLAVSVLAVYRIYTRQKGRVIAREKEVDLLLAVTQGEERERKRVAGELHDGIASALIAIKMRMEQSEEPQPSLIALIRRTHGEVRQIAHNLFPVDFKTVSLPAAIGQFCATFPEAPVAVVFRDNTDDVALSAERSLLFYRAVQELVQNAYKHAKPTQINVQFSRADHQEYLLSVEDNGEGFDFAAQANAPGLRGVKDRLQQGGAELDFDSAPGRGTSVFIRFKAS